jgi:hypothetical protein
MGSKKCNLAIVHGDGALAKTRRHLLNQMHEKLEHRTAIDAQ